VLRGMADMDNAGVYKLSDDIAIIQTLDFFTPVVDDPYAFGQIAAANALSDVYVMGGRPVTAMNIAGFPSKTLDITILHQILTGGAEKLMEAGVVLIGGHTVDDSELKYGLSVTGTIHPNRLITNGGVMPGDRLVLTKPLGLGIMTTALKAGRLDEKATRHVTMLMAALNDKASQLMQEAGAHACTDITGFGFAGHVTGMAMNSGVGIVIDSSALPVIPETVKLAAQGLLPGGLHNNRDFYTPKVKIARGLPKWVSDVIFDPQTSGGLLIAVSADKANALLKSLKRAGIASAAIVGEAVKSHKGILTVS
jgi:selenide,water dikinase